MEPASDEERERESMRDGTRGWCGRGSPIIAGVGANNRTEKHEFQLRRAAGLPEQRASTHREPNRSESSKDPVAV